MSSVKRSNSSASRKSKKARTAPQEATPLGSFVKDTAAKEVDQTELELEEAVFGKSRGPKGSVWDLAEEDTLQVDEDEEDPETGLERLRDENVSWLSRLFSWTGECAWEELQEHTRSPRAVM